MKQNLKNKNSYLIESNPINAGEPTITAIVIIIPKITPTIMNRLFIIKNIPSPVKNEMN